MFVIVQKNAYCMISSDPEPRRLEDIISLCLQKALKTRLTWLFCGFETTILQLCGAAAVGGMYSVIIHIFPSYKNWWWCSHEHWLPPCVTFDASADMKVQTHLTNTEGLGLNKIDRNTILDLTNTFDVCNISYTAYDKIIRSKKAVFILSTIIKLASLLSSSAFHHHPLYLSAHKLTHQVKNSRLFSNSGSPGRPFRG